MLVFSNVENVLRKVTLFFYNGRFKKSLRFLKAPSGNFSGQFGAR